MPLNPLQIKGVLTFFSSLSLGLTPVAEPIFMPDPTPPPAVVEQVPSIVLSVPFSSQAPEGNWKQPWGDACEETSILMVDRFYKNRTEIGVEEARDAILNIFRVKEGVFGPSYDESAQKVKQMVELINSNWRAEIQEAPTVEQIKNELRQNRPVIVPLYARDLGNPYYTDEGPDYHMLVITGFNDEKGVFIVNDPGTRHGFQLEFGYDVVMNTIHDLSKPDYKAGEKRVLFTRRMD